jgi:hypothetical protein
MGCEEVRLLLEERIGACRGDVGRLRGELERIAGLVSSREKELARLTTALEVVAGLPLAHLPPLMVGELVPVPAARAAPVGGAAVRADAAAAFGGRVLGVLRSGPVEGMRCGEVARELGLAPVAREVEKVRHHCKRLVAAGHVSQGSPGLFAPASPPVATPE